MRDRRADKTEEQNTILREEKLNAHNNSFDWFYLLWKFIFFLLCHTTYLLHNFRVYFFIHFLLCEFRAIHGANLRTINLLNGILRASFFLPLSPFLFFPFRTGCR